MKKITVIFAILNLFFSFQLHHEFKLENLTSEEPHEFFIGMNNHISISEGQITKLKIGNKEFYPIDNKKQVFELQFYSQGTEIVEFYNGDELIQKIEFKVKRVGNPIIKLSGVSPQEKIKVDQILSNPKLELFCESKLKKIPFQIESFTMTSFNKHGEIITSSSNSSDLSPSMVQTISTLRSEAIILIEDVKIKGPDNYVRKIPGLTYKVEG